MFEVFEPLSSPNLTKLHRSHFLRHQQFGAGLERVLRLVELPCCVPPAMAMGQQLTGSVT